MGTSLLARTDIQEALSVAYLQAIAASAGYTVAKKDFDRDGIDITVEAGGDQRPKLDLQLKATTRLKRLKNGRYRFSLPTRNFELLRISTQTPRILMIYVMPPEMADWCVVTNACLYLRRRAYWVNLNGHQSTSNLASVDIDVPEENLLNVDALRVLMDHSRAGTL